MMRFSTRLSIRFWATAIATALCAALAAPAARADITVLDNNKTIDVDCAKDARINLQGNHLTINASGVCTAISIDGNEATVTGSAIRVIINGNHNTLDLAAADEVAVRGNENTVTVHKPVKAKAPRVSNTGKNNRLTLPK
jgi:hypothetical protein